MSTTIDVAQKAAVQLVKHLEQIETDQQALQAKIQASNHERDVANTKVAELERQLAERDKQIADLKSGLKDARAEIDRLNAIIAPPAPPPVAVVKTHVQSDPRPTIDKRNLPGTPGHPSPGELANDPRYGGRAGNPVPPDSDNDHTHQRAVAAAEREQDRKDQKAEDAREDRAAVKASLQPPARHK